MKLNLLFLLSFIFSMAMAQQRDTTYSFMMQPIDTTKAPELRSYTVVIPSGYNPQSMIGSPLIINLHGFYESISSYRASITIDSIAEANNAIMVYPLGDTCSWVYKPLPFLPNSGNGWNAGIIRGDFDDVEFISRVIDSVNSKYYNTSFLAYVMGLSNGGNMAVKLAAALGDTKLMSAASIIGFDSLSPSINNLQVPFMTILGEKDTIIRYNGIPNIYPSWPSIRSKWLTINGNCSPPQFFVDTMPDLDTTDNCWIERTRYYICGNPNLIYHEYLIKNGGHNLPNTGTCTSPPIVCNALGPINNDIDPSVEIWNFFYSIITKTKETKAKTKELKVFPNPSSGLVQFEFSAAEANGMIDIYDINGRLVHSKLLDQGMANYFWDNSEERSGIYFYQLKVNGEVHSGKIQLINPH